MYKLILVGAERISAVALSGWSAIIRIDQYAQWLPIPVT